MKYIKLVIAVVEQYQEVLIAELMELEFEEFQQTDDELITYIPQERFYVGDRERIEHLLSSYQGKAYIKSEEIVKDQNWNAKWEATIQAKAIGPFLIRPTWSTKQPSPHQILLEIDPKMAFGTGYHETTRLMLQLLPDVIKGNEKVLDAGTGSGILSIASVKLGTDAVVAFDIDEWSVTNARENINLNETADQITIRQGTQVVIDGDEFFDLILANIQLNVIKEMLPFFDDHLKQKGSMLLSGLLATDEGKINRLLDENGFSVNKINRENEWIAIWAQK